MSHLPTTVITTQLPFSQAAFVKQLWTQISSRTSNRLKLYKPSNQCLHWMDSPKWFKHGIEFYFHDWKHACAFFVSCSFLPNQFDPGALKMASRAIWCPWEICDPWFSHELLMLWNQSRGIPGHVSHDFPTELALSWKRGAGSAVSRSTCSLVAEWSLFHGIGGRNTFWCRKVAFWISWMVLTCLK